MFPLTRAVARSLALLTLLTALATCRAPSTPPVPMVSSPTATVAGLPTATATLSAPSEEAIMAGLTAFFVHLRFDGAVLVAREGKVLLRHGYGEADRAQKVPNTAQTKFRIASLTKQFTAMALLILQARGQLNVQDRVCAYLAPCPPAWQTITLHQLLTHTAGLPNYLTFPDWGTFRATPVAPAATIARFSNKPLDFPPGEQWNYSNSGYVVLGRIIEQVAGTTYTAFLQAHIFAPLQMADTGYRDNPAGLAIGYTDATTTAPAAFVASSVLYAAGGLYSTVDDLYLWDQAVARDTLLPTALRAKLFTPYRSIPDGSGLSYGYGWFIGAIANHRVVGHPGRIEGFSALNTYYPDDKVVVIVLGNQENESVFYIGVQLAKIVFGVR